MNASDDSVLDRIEPGDWITISLLLVGVVGVAIAGIGVCMRRHPHTCARCLSWCRRSRVSPTDVERAADTLHDIGGRLSPVAIRLRVPPPPVRRQSASELPAILINSLLPVEEPVYVEPSVVESLPVPEHHALPWQPKLPIARLARSSQPFLDTVLQLDAYPGELTGRNKKEQPRSFRRVASLRMPMRA